MKIPKQLLIPLVLITVTLSVGGYLKYINNSNSEKTKEKQVIITSQDEKTEIQSEADPVIESHINEAFEMLKKHGEMSKQVWPDYDLSQNNIIACEIDDFTKKITNAWKLTTTTKSRLTKEQINSLEVPPIGAYNSTKFEGKKSIIIGISKSRLQELNNFTNYNFVYEVGVHEIFHIYNEPFMSLIKISIKSKNSGSRGTEFPKKAEPRVYRKMILDNLVLAFENPKDEKTYLGKAKYWNEKWKSKYPEEYYQGMTYDILEGKARYIQNMMCIMYDGISDEEKVSEIKNLFNKSSNPHESIDAESYSLGFVAGVLLDRGGSNWKKKITKHPEAPVEYLLKDVNIIKGNYSDFEEMLKVSENQMREVNKNIDSKLKTIKEGENDVNIPYLQIKSKFLNGSFETSDFINYLDLDLDVNLDFTGTFKNKNGSIYLKNLSIYSSKDNKNDYVLPLNMDYKISNGRFIINNENIKGDIKVKQTKDKDGRIIYIMK
ncbi:MAG: hypothetical protein RRZ84_07980 [Romboutsia sp.]